MRQGIRLAVALPVGERTTRSLSTDRKRTISTLSTDHMAMRELRFGVKSLMSNALIRPLAPETPVQRTNSKF